MIRRLLPHLQSLVTPSRAPRRARRKRAPSSGRGFTLLEMMVVVAILGLMAAVAVPDLSPMVHNAKLRASGDEIVNFIERARRSARAEGRCYRVRMDGDMLAMERRTHADCVSAAGLATGWSVVTKVSKAPNMDYDFRGLDGSDAIIFRPNGRMRGNADIDVENDGARVFISYPPMGAVGNDVVVTAFGRVCVRRVFGDPGAPTAPMVCGSGFVDGTAVSGGGSGGGAAPGPGFGSGGGSFC